MADVRMHHNTPEIRGRAGSIDSIPSLHASNSPRTPLSPDTDDYSVILDLSRLQQEADQDGHEVDLPSHSPVAEFEEHREFEKVHDFHHFSVADNGMCLPTLEEKSFSGEFGGLLRPPPSPKSMVDPHEPYQKIRGRIHSLSHLRSTPTQENININGPHGDERGYHEIISQGGTAPKVPPPSRPGGVGPNAPSLQSKRGAAELLKKPDAHRQNKVLFMQPRLIVDWSKWHDAEESLEVQWSELFMDLVMVAAVLKLGNIFAADITIAQTVIICLHYSLLWTTWNAVNIYTTRFAQRDLVNALYYFLHGACLLGMTVEFDGSISHTRHGERGFIIFLILSRVILSIMYYVVAHYLARARKVSYIIILSYVISFSLYLLSLFVSHPAAVASLWFLGIVVEFAFAIYSSSIKEKLPVSNDHYSERLGLLVIIMLGEGVLSIVLNDSAQGSGSSASFFYMLFSAFLLLSLLQLLYFDSMPHADDPHALKNGGILRGYTFSICHLVLGASLLCVSVGLKKMLSHLDKDPLYDSEIALVSYSLFVTLVMLSTIRLCHKSFHNEHTDILSPHFHLKSYKRVLWFMRGFLITSCLFVPLISSSLSLSMPGVMTILTFILVSLLGIDLWGRSHKIIDAAIEKAKREFQIGVFRRRRHDVGTTAHSRVTHHHQHHHGLHVRKRRGSDSSVNELRRSPSSVLRTLGPRKGPPFSDGRRDSLSSVESASNNSIYSEDGGLNLTSIKLARTGSI